VATGASPIPRSTTAALYSPPRRSPIPPRGKPFFCCPTGLLSFTIGRGPPPRDTILHARSRSFSERYTQIPQCSVSPRSSPHTFLRARHPLSGRFSTLLLGLATHCPPRFLERMSFTARFGDFSHWVHQPLRKSPSLAQLTAYPSRCTLQQDSSDVIHDDLLQTFLPFARLPPLPFFRDLDAQKKKPVGPARA